MSACHGFQDGRIEINVDLLDTHFLLRDAEGSPRVQTWMLRVYQTPLKKPYLPFMLGFNVRS